MCHVLCVHMPYEEILCHMVPTMITHKPSFFEGRGEPQHSRDRIPDLCKISDVPTQRRRLSAHECVETLPFREDFDEIGDF